ncbi:MAG: hypothetical protein M2R46_00989 [Verrucomicrobia subdivision 3 bacterium]|nr:hypothetical protein [Limisphaerales bacterium]
MARKEIRPFKSLTALYAAATLLRPFPVDCGQGILLGTPLVTSQDQEKIQSGEESPHSKTWRKVFQLLNHFIGRFFIVGLRKVATRIGLSFARRIGGV